MKAKPWAGQRGLTFLGLSYGIAILASLFFVGVFGAFLFHGMVTLFSRAQGSYLPQLVWETLQTLGVAFLISMPLAALLSFRLLDERTSRRPWLYLILRESLRCPTLVFGIVVIYFAKAIDITSLLPVVLSGLMIPRFAYGWFRILERDIENLSEVGGAMGLGPWQIFFHLVLPIRWAQLVEYSLKVVAILAGAVAPLVYLTSLSVSDVQMTGGGYFTLEAFASLVKGQDQAPEVWMLLSLLSILTLVFSTGESYEENTSRWRVKYG